MSPWLKISRISQHRHTVTYSNTGVSLALLKSTKRPNNQQIQTQVYWALGGWRDERSGRAQLASYSTRAATPPSQRNRTSYSDTKVLLQMQELLQKTTLFSQVLLGLCLRTQASQLWYTASATRRKLRVTPAAAASSGTPKLNAGRLRTQLFSHARRLRVARGLVRKRATAVVYQTGEKRLVFFFPPLNYLSGLFPTMCRCSGQPAKEQSGNRIFVLISIVYTDPPTSLQCLFVLCDHKDANTHWIFGKNVTHDWVRAIPVCIRVDTAAAAMTMTRGGGGGVRRRDKGGQLRSDLRPKLLRPRLKSYRKTGT